MCPESRAYFIPMSADVTGQHGAEKFPPPPSSEAPFSQPKQEGLKLLRVVCSVLHRSGAEP